ncbi:hypothetical protein PtA15_4A595 [Puccinia triticina]|uniref:Uncharacterized protein n=1 Tax=Puccinia triticina TaxID=208348 RepID=A0ABY7CHJ7_9BASI|nr:uncharacterized protein PtA15_4A595 [Puccinia triticina]WAQ84144.1 hypothetical protein PtA15_4A595 [Puccinia triticina]
MLQSTLTGQDIRDSSQASATIDELFRPDFQVDPRIRRIDEEVGSRKRVKHSQGHPSSPQEMASDSKLKSGSLHDRKYDGNFQSAQAVRVKLMKATSQLKTKYSCCLMNWESARQVTPLKMTKLWQNYWLTTNLISANL